MKKTLPLLILIMIGIVTAMFSITYGLMNDDSFEVTHAENTPLVFLTILLVPVAVGLILTLAVLLYT